MYYVCMYGEIEGKWQNVKNVKDRSSPSVWCDVPSPLGLLSAHYLSAHEVTIVTVPTHYRCPGNICSLLPPPASELDQKDLDFTKLSFYLFIIWLNHKELLIVDYF